MQKIITNSIKYYDVFINCNRYYLSTLKGILQMLGFFSFRRCVVCPSTFLSIISYDLNIWFSILQILFVVLFIVFYVRFSILHLLITPLLSSNVSLYTILSLIHLVSLSYSLVQMMHMPCVRHSIVCNEYSRGNIYFFKQYIEYYIE